MLHQTIGSDGCDRYSTRLPSTAPRPGGDRHARVVGEADGPAVPEHRLYLGAAGVAAVGELPEQRVEVRRAGEQRAAVRLRRSNSPLKAASAGEGTEADAEHQQLGPVGRAASFHLSYTASNNARPAVPARIWSTMNDTHDGRYEYWIATLATSPPVRYSRLSMAPGSTQPVPVVPATSRYFRSKPPARGQVVDRQSRPLLDVRCRRDPGVGPDRRQRRAHRRRRRSAPASDRSR